MRFGVRFTPDALLLLPLVVIPALVPLFPLLRPGAVEIPRYVTTARCAPPPRCYG